MKPRRRRLRPWLLVLLQAALPDASARADATWSLAEFTDAALAASPQVETAQARLEAALARAEETAAGRWPALSFAGLYQHTSEVQRITFPAAGGAPARTLAFGDGEVRDLSLGLRVPLYTGGETPQRARADALAAESEAGRLAADSLDVLRRARDAWFVALGAEAVEAAATAALRRVERRARELETQLELGAASQEALLLAASRRLQAERERVSAAQRAVTSRLHLGELAGLPGTTIVPRGDPERSLLDDGPSAGGLPPGDAPSRRPELGVLARAAERQQAIERAERARLGPQLGLDFALHRGRPGVDVVANDWMTWSATGLTVRLTLWDHGARRRRIAQARAAGRAAGAELRELEWRLRTATAAASARVGAARRERELAAERAALEARLLAMIEERLRRGAASEIEYLDAQDELAEAEAALASATAAERLAEVEWLYAVGR